MEHHRLQFKILDFKNGLQFLYISFLGLLCRFVVLTPKISSPFLLENDCQSLSICGIFGMMTRASDTVLLIYCCVVILKFNEMFKWLLALILHRIEHLGIDVVLREHFSMICDQILKLKFFLKKSKNWWIHLQYKLGVICDNFCDIYY